MCEDRKDEKDIVYLDENDVRDSRDLTDESLTALRERNRELEEKISRGYPDPSAWKRIRDLEEQLKEKENREEKNRDWHPGFVIGLMLIFAVLGFCAGSELGWDRLGNFKNDFWQTIEENKDKLKVEYEEFKKLIEDQLEDPKPPVGEVQEMQRDEVSEFANQIFPVEVDYSRSLKEMISAGKYEWAHSDIIEEHFPIFGQDKYKVDLELIHFNKVINSDEVLAELKKRGYRPATLPELLAFGAKYPDEPGWYPIVALGSVWLGWRYYYEVPYLWSSDRIKRYLFLSRLEDVWPGFYRFLAVRENSSVNEKTWY